VHYCQLFKLLVGRHQVSASTVRALLKFYTGNFVRVQWCGIVSDNVLALNGVKQGCVFSPILFCLYIDGLLVALPKAGFGRFINLVRILWEHFSTPTILRYLRHHICATFNVRYL